MNSTVRVLAFVLAMPVLLAQAGLNGRWAGQTPNGQAIVMDLTVKGESLAVTMTVGKEQAAIENGKVAGTTFTFTATMGGGSEAFTGEVSGDEIKMWMDDRGPAAAITLKRATPARE